jgi:hypothetical protein
MRDAPNNDSPFGVHIGRILAVVGTGYTKLDLCTDLRDSLTRTVRYICIKRYGSFQRPTEHENASVFVAIAGKLEDVCRVPDAIGAANLDTSEVIRSTINDVWCVLPDSNSDDAAAVVLSGSRSPSPPQKVCSDNHIKRKGVTTSIKLFVAAQQRFNCRACKQRLDHT